LVVVDGAGLDDAAGAVDVDVAQDANLQLEATVEAPTDDNGDATPADGSASDDESVPGAIRPLGSAPLLDSKPLPATMPGMLRPRSIEDFTLPAQRPAFEVSPERSADRG
jgi:arginase